jgi:hypothetical protein
MAALVVDVVTDDSSFTTRTSRGGLQTLPFTDYKGQTVGFLADEGDGLIQKDDVYTGVKGTMFTASGPVAHGRYTSKRFAQAIANSTSGRAMIGVVDTYGKGWVLKPGADKAQADRITAHINDGSAAAAK